MSSEKDYDVLSSQNAKKRSYKKKTEWTKATESLLIERWEEKIMQLRGNRKNQHVYAEIAAELQKSGLTATAVDIKNKVHNLTARYRKEKCLVGPSGGSPSEWPLFSRLHSFLGSYKYYNLTDVLCDSVSVSSPPSSSSAANIPEEAPSTSSAAQSFYSSDNSRLTGSTASCYQTPSESMSRHIVSEAESSPPMQGLKKNKFQQQIMRRIDSANQKMEQYIAAMEAIGNKLVEDESKKRELLTDLAKKQSEVMDTMLSFINNMK